MPSGPISCTTGVVSLTPYRKPLALNYIWNSDATPPVADTSRKIGGSEIFNIYAKRGLKLCESFRHGSFDEMNKESKVVPFDWH